MILTGESCRLCGHTVSRFVDRGDDLRGHLCETCHVKLLEIREQFIREINNGSEAGTSCAQCHKDFDAVQVMTGKRSMYLHVTDGVMALLCQECSGAYDRKALNNKTLRGREKHLSKQEFAVLQRKAGRG